MRQIEDIFMQFAVNLGAGCEKSLPYCLEYGCVLDKVHHTVLGAEVPTANNVDNSGPVR